MEIKGRDVLKVRCISTGHSYDKESEMKGEKYNRYTYKGKVFIANAKDPFVKTQTDGTLYSAELDTNDEGQLSLVGWTSTVEEINMAKTESTLNTIGASAVVTAMTETELAELEKTGD